MDSQRRPLSKTSKFLAATAISATAAIAALPLFAAPDTAGHNGKGLDIAQLESRSTERFAELDQDSDGLVTSSEFLAATPDESRPQRRHFKRGKHRNGFGDQAFDALDSDSNGQISRAEFDNRHELRKQMHNTSHRQARFEKLDVNGDGAITLDEMQTRVQRLKDFDADNDGRLTRKEMRNARASMREQHRSERSAQQRG